MKEGLVDEVLVGAALAVLPVSTLPRSRKQKRKQRRRIIDTRKA